MNCNQTEVDTTMTAQTFAVPTYRLASLTKRLDKLAKKSNKYGTEMVSYKIGEAYNVELDKDVFVEKVDITVSGEAPKYGDYTFAAKVELMGEENLVHNVADIDLDSRFRTMVSECDHCGHNRVRNDVFVFVDNKTGEQVAVGRTCLRDFTGCDNPQEITARATWLSDAADIFEDELDNLNNYSGPVSLRLSRVMQIAAANIRTFGWLSKSNEDIAMGKMSTASMVELDLKPNAKHTPAEVTQQDVDLASETIEYFRSASYFGSDYLDNVRIILGQDYIKEKHLGIAVSGINHIIREKVKQAETASKAETSEYIGAVKQRGKDISMKFVKEIYLGSGPYGEKYIYSFIEGDGNEAVWFTSKQDFTIGETYSMDFTVKEHKEYNGVKQTVITRAKVK